MTLTAERVRELLDYNPETGILTWKVSMSATGRKGAEAGTVRPDGYRQVKIENVIYRSNRLAWLIMTGNWPVHDVDHKDRNKQNNRWKNLQDITTTENSQRLQAPNGGVYWSKQSNLWIARVRDYGRRIYIGSSKDRTVAEYLYELYCAKHLPHKLPQTK